MLDNKMRGSERLYIDSTLIVKYHELVVCVGYMGWLEQLLLQNCTCLSLNNCSNTARGGDPETIRWRPGAH